MRTKLMGGSSRIQVVLYTRQPFVAAGLRCGLRRSRDFRLPECFDTVPAALHFLRHQRPDILLVDLTSSASLAELAAFHSIAPTTQVVLWGAAPGGDFVFQSMRLGVRGILPSDAPVASFLATLVSIHAGVLCFEKNLVERVMLQERVPLTARQGQIVSLVAQGLKNKAIACRLGITEGTVKVYLYKLFKKLGVNDRLGMALYGLENLGHGGFHRGPFVPESLPMHSRREGAPQSVN